ncbi:MAG: hypothetical protein ACYC2T_01365 [Bacillota bacterium]
MEAIQALVFMSIVVEFIVGVFKKLISDRYSQLVSMGVGVLLCITYRVGIFAAMGLITDYPIVDYVLSGIVVSRGSNALYDLVSKRKSA